MDRKSTITKVVFLIAVVFICMAVLSTRSAIAGAEPLNLIIAFSDTGLTHEEFSTAATQLADMLGDKLDRRVMAMVPPGDPEKSNEWVILAAQQGRADISGLATFSYLVAHDTAGAEMIVNTFRFGQNWYSSQIMTHDQTGFTELGDFDGVDFCWPDPNSFSGYIIPSLVLQAAGVTPGPGSQFVAGHPAVIQMLYNRECDAGASYVDVRDSIRGEFPDVDDVVPVIHVSPPIPNDGFSVAGDMPAELKSAVAAALVEISEDEAGLLLLEQLGFTTLVPTDHSLFAGLEDLLSAAGMTPQEFWDKYFGRPTAKKEMPLRFFIAYRDTGLTHEEFTIAAGELAELLGEKLDRRVIAMVPPGDPKRSNDWVILAAQQGRADISGMRAFAYLVAHDTAGAEIVANAFRFGQNFYLSQIMTHDLTGYTELGDFDGVDFCWADPNSFSGYVIPSLVLQAAGVTPGAGSQFVPGHPAVIQYLYYHDCDAGASYVDVRDSIQGEFPDVYDVVPVIHVSPPIPNDAFSVSADLSADWKMAIAAALIEISEDEAGLPLLEQLGFTTLVPTDHSLFTGLEDLLSAAGITSQEFWDTLPW